MSRVGKRHGQRNARHLPKRHAVRSAQAMALAVEGGSVRRAYENMSSRHKRLQACPVCLSQLPGSPMESQ